MLAKGYVKDAYGTPIDMVTVQLKSNLGVGKFTNANGYFELEVPTGSVLKISMLGYFDKEVLASSSMNISLEQQLTDIEEIVIVSHQKSEKTNWWLVLGVSLLSVLAIREATKKTKPTNSKSLNKPASTKKQPIKVVL